MESRVATGEVTVVAPPAVQRLWIPGRFPGMNEIVAASKGNGGRGYGYARLKAAETERVAWRAREQQIRPITRARFHFTWREPDRQRNPDNIAAGGRKFVFDGLVLIKLLANDGWGQIAGWSDEFEVSDQHGVLVLIEEVGKDVGCSSPRRR